MESGALELMLIYNQTLHPTALPIINRRIDCDYHQTTTWRTWPRKSYFGKVTYLTQPVTLVTAGTGRQKRGCPKNSLTHAPVI